MESVTLIINNIVNYMVSLGPIGGFVLILLESVLPPLPLGAIVGLNMLSFGNVYGFILSYVAVIIGCMTSFFLFRYLLKDKDMKWFNQKNKERIKKWMNKLSNIKFTTLVIVFALPITPAFLVNIAGGLSEISYKKYLMALIVGKPAMLLFYGYIAVSLVDSLKDPANILRVVLLVTITYIISKIIERVVKVES